MTHYLRPILSLLLILTLFNSTSEAKKLKIATISPDGSSWMQIMRTGAKEIAQQTENKVRIKFYPGGVMGDDSSVLRKIRFGQLQGGVFVSGSLSNVYPDIQIYSLPLTFESFDEVDYVRKYMDAQIKGGMDRNGFVVLGVAEGGFAYLMSKVPVLSLSDLMQQKVWIPDNDAAALETVKAFGVSPIPLSIADVRTGLQTGLINTVAGSAIGAIALQWHTQVKYLTNIPILYISGLLVVDKKAFLKLSPEHQNIVRDVMARSFEVIDSQNRKENLQALAALKNQGIQFLDPSDETIDEWKGSAAKVSQRLVKSGKLSETMVTTFHNHLDTFRSK